MSSPSSTTFGGTSDGSVPPAGTDPTGTNPIGTNPTGADPAVLADVKAILRDSLRLGPGVSVDDDMALVGGSIDLDSIDILLVVSNIEKHFKIKIPNEAVGRSAFANVGTLAKYVSDNRELLRVVTAAAVPPGGAPALSPADYLAKLPHGPEFRYITAVTDVAPGKAAAGYWHARGDEPFFAGHFPGRPLVPGVIITEALAQMAGIASIDGGPGEGGTALLAAVDVRFFLPVVPPATIELRAERTGGEWPFARCAVTASVGGQLVASGTVELRLGAGF